MSGAGTRLHTRHQAMDARLHAQDPASEGLYWHVQDITMGELHLVTSVGLGRGLGIEWVAPLRRVTTRIRYEDGADRPFTPEDADIHHRNETLSGTGDHSVLLHVGRRAGSWTVAGRAGVSVPLGRTEPNPFRLGDLGLLHQHIQFGTGTWDPVAGVGAGRRFGEFGVNLGLRAHLVVAENEHGYQSGHRYQAHAEADRRIVGDWHFATGLDLLREQPERWDGRTDHEEGNLGRTDLMLSLGLIRGIRGFGGLHLTVQIPLFTRAAGQQLDYPVIVSVGFSR